METLEALCHTWKKYPQKIIKMSYPRMNCKFVHGLYHTKEFQVNTGVRQMYIVTSSLLVSYILGKEKPKEEMTSNGSFGPSWMILILLTT